MFTAEEIEDCDILPKKLSLGTVLKMLFYFCIMISILILLYSFYSGKDFSSIISMESMKYSTDDYITKRLYIIGVTTTNYDVKDKYHVNYTEITRTKFIKEYVRESLPCIVKNMTSGVSAMRNIDNSSYLEHGFTGKQLTIEERKEPISNFMSSDYRAFVGNYAEFVRKANDNARMYNYFINEVETPKALQDEFGIHKLDFLRDLKLEGMKYSEGFSEMHNPSYSTTYETVICQMVGQVDIIIIPALHRNYIYPFKKPYGLSNYSPINFFKAEYGRFPEFKKVSRMYVNLEQGDCLYIPAFWWYMTKTEENQHFITITTLFKSHSRLVEDMIHGIEVNNF
jgi:hypothetical protein